MSFDPTANQATPARSTRRATKAKAPTPAEPPTIEAAEANYPPPEPAAVPPATALLELPIHTCYGDGRYAAQYVEMKLSRRRAAALNFLWASWSTDGQRYENGRSGHPDGAVIENGPDALKFVLDLLADEIERQTGKMLITDFGFIFN